MTAHEEQWWSAEEFAEELGITPRWLKDRCAPGWKGEPLPHQRIPGIGVRFSPEDRVAIKADMARGPRPTPQTGSVPLDLTAGLKGLAKLRKLQGATP